MKTINKSLRLGRAIMAAAAMTAFGSAFAQDDDLAKLTQLESSVGVGASAVSGDQGDRSIFGQYNGMREDRGYLNLDIDYVKRDDATGTWTRFQGRNLGLDSRDLSATWQKQGDWKFTGDYSELVHREIRTVNTGMLGVGTTTPTIPAGYPLAGAGTDYHFQLKRTALGLSGDKWIDSSLQLQVSFRNEDKDGTRFWGRGYDCSGNTCNSPNTANSLTNQRWAVLMLPEPVDSNTKQVEAKLNFHTDKLFVSGGYYGSFYTNSNGNLTLSGPTQLNSPLGSGSLATLSTNGSPTLQGVLQLPMALQPDNEAHQLYVDGNYRFTPKTTANFKLAYTRATQDESFAGMGLADGTQPRVDLGGQLGPAEHETAARPAERFVGRRRHDVRVRERARMDARRDQAGDVRHVDHQDGVCLRGDGAEPRIADAQDGTDGHGVAFVTAANLPYGSAREQRPANSARSRAHGR